MGQEWCENVEHLVEKERLQALRKNLELLMPIQNGRYPSNIIGEVNSSEQKYFYAPRATRKERD